MPGSTIGTCIVIQNCLLNSWTIFSDIILSKQQKEPRNAAQFALNMTWVAIIRKATHYNNFPYCYVALDCIFRQLVHCMLLNSIWYIDMALVNLQINGLPINSLKWPIHRLIPTQQPTDMVAVADMVDIGKYPDIVLECYTQLYSKLYHAWKTGFAN